MGRPADWSPLAGSDPVPGDPAGISAAAAHLSGVADQIAGQVATLRKMAVGHSDEKGQHADKLQAAAADTAGKLDKVTGRYRETAAALAAWVPELEYAQAQSAKALAQAQEAHGRQRAFQPVQRPPGTHPTPAEQQQDQARGNALTQANADMAASQSMLADAVAHRDQAAAQAASKIHSAIGTDSDSWLDDVGSFFSSAWGWVTDHWVPLLKDACTGLEIIAAVLAVVCLFIPGLNIIDALLWVAFGATLLATIGRGALAATGNGSWLDFGLDVLALATFGATKIFSTGLKTAADGAVETGEGLVASERESLTNEYMDKFFGSTSGRLIGEGPARALSAEWAEQKIPDLALDAGKAPYFTKFANAIKAGGSLTDYGNFSKLSAVAARYGGDPNAAAAMSKGNTAMAGLRIASGANWGGALSGLTGGGGEMDNMHGAPVFRATIPGVSGVWDKFEHFTTHALPGCKVAAGGGG